MWSGQVWGMGGGSGQVWGHTPEQRVAASTLRRYFYGLRLAIALADARPVMLISFRYGLHPTQSRSMRAAPRYDPTHQNPTRQNPMCEIFCWESSHMSIDNL